MMLKQENYIIISILLNQKIQKEVMFQVFYLLYIFLERVGFIDPGDFLDPITEDLPKGVWCRSYNAKKSLVMIHNLKWVGFHYFHHTSLPRYGGIYIGNGKPENNLVFMIPN